MLNIDYTISINRAVRSGLGTAGDELEASKMDEMRTVGILISMDTVAVLISNRLIMPRTYCWSSP